MIRVEIAAKTRQIAADLAAALAEDERIRLVRSEAISFTYRPHPEAEVVIAFDVNLRSMPPGGPRVVVLTDEPGRVRRDASVRARLPLDTSPSEIAAAIVAAQAGLYALTSDQLPPELQESDIFEEHLTPREIEVLRMMADGAKNREIAERLRISANTAKFHVAQVLAKLSAASRAEAVQIGIRRGLVPV